MTDKATSGTDSRNYGRLLPCPFCGGEPNEQHFNVTPNLPGRLICSCGAEMRQGRNQSSAELTAAWNTRAERTCRIVKEKRTLRSMLHGECEVVDEKCSECGGYMDVGFGVIRNYCPNCGARVIS